MSRTFREAEASIVPDGMKVTEQLASYMANVANLQPFVTVIDNKTVTIDYDIISAMHDGKEVTTLAKDLLR